MLYLRLVVASETPVQEHCQRDIESAIGQCNPEITPPVLVSDSHVLIDSIYVRVRTEPALGRRGCVYRVAAL